MSRDFAASPVDIALAVNFAFYMPNEFDALRSICRTKYFEARQR
jgi:hypothetical protein